MADAGAVELPLFELPVVLLPGELLPLHVFEERYKAMIGHCLEQDRPFGVLLSDEDGARGVGCTAEIAEVLDHFDDGRLNIVVLGAAPFRVLDRNETESFPTATVEPIDLAAEPEEQDAEASERARIAFETLARDAAESPEEVAQAPEGDCYSIAARITLPADAKQVLLESRSEAERMRILARSLEAVVEAMRRSNTVAEVAKSNGHARL